MFEFEEKSEFQKNRDLLKRCKIVDTIVFFGYVLSFVIITMLSIITMFNLTFSEGFLVFFFGFLVSIAIIITGAMSSTRREYKIIAIPPTLTALSALLCTVICDVNHFYFLPEIAKMYLYLLPLSIILTVLAVFNAKDFLYLESQEGYPYFNERVEEKKHQREQYDIKSEYEATYERVSNNKVQRYNGNSYRYTINSSNQNSDMDDVE